MSVDRDYMVYVIASKQKVSKIYKDQFYLSEAEAMAYMKTITCAPEGAFDVYPVSISFLLAHELDGVKPPAPILGQEAITPEGLGRITYLSGEWITVTHYADTDVPSDWQEHEVTLVPIAGQHGSRVIDYSRS